MIRSGRKLAKLLRRQALAARIPPQRQDIGANLRKASDARARAASAPITSEQIDDAMIRTIIGCMENEGSVRESDFVRLGIPRTEVQRRFRRCVNIAQEQVVNRNFA